MKNLWFWPLGSCGSGGKVVTSDTEVTGFIPDPCGQHTGDTLAQIALKLCRTCVSMLLLPNEPVSLWAGVIGVVKTACNLHHFKQSKRRACSIYSPFKALWGIKLLSWLQCAGCRMTLETKVGSDLLFFNANANWGQTPVVCHNRDS